MFLNKRIIIVHIKSDARSVAIWWILMPLKSSLYFENVLHFRCPAVLPTAVKRAADQKMISASAYMRQAIADQLRRDGVELNSHEAA